METHHRKWHEFLALGWLVRPLCLDVVSALPSQAQSGYAAGQWTDERGHERNIRDFFWRSSFLVQNTWMTFQDSGTCLSRLLFTQKGFGISLQHLSGCLRFRQEIVAFGERVPASASSGGHSTWPSQQSLRSGVGIRDLLSNQVFSRSEIPKS